MTAEATQGPRKGRGRQPTFDHEEAAALYRELGWSVARIASYYNVTDMTVYRAFKKMDITLHWTKKRSTCRNGHARMFWSYKDHAGKWRCRRCARGEVGHVFLVCRDGVPKAIFSTLDLAVRACPANCDWAGVDDNVWAAGTYMIQAYTFDPNLINNEKL